MSERTSERRLGRFGAAASEKRPAKQNGGLSLSLFLTCYRRNQCADVMCAFGTKQSEKCLQSGRRDGVSIGQVKAVFALLCELSLSLLSAPMGFFVRSESVHQDSQKSWLAGCSLAAARFSAPI